MRRLAAGAAALLLAAAGPLPPPPPRVAVTGGTVQGRVAADGDQVAFAQDSVPAADSAAGQDSSADIVVTGIRASQARAIEVKRDAASVVDAISAEDIGKLPDVTISDSLQRITGVQIRRDAGEGAAINIRGLPQVTTLLNGEAYLGANSITTIQPNFNDIPSQLFSGADVIKSTTADLLNAGITGNLMPDRGFAPELADEFNRITALEYERIRDFLLLHYWANRRTGEPLWDACRATPLPEELAHKVQLFRSRGVFARYELESFRDPSWLSMYAGFDLLPQRYDPLADHFTDTELEGAFARMREAIGRAMALAQPHRAYLQVIGGLAG